MSTAEIQNKPVQVSKLSGASLNGIVHSRNVFSQFSHALFFFTSSKTPLSIYLGYLGYKTANLPIVKGIEPPEQLWQVEAARVIGLTLEAERLAEIRQRRADVMGSAPGDYATLSEIYEELDYADQVHRRLGCPVIEVSELAIEETAHRIARIVERRVEESTESARPEPADQ